MKLVHYLLPLLLITNLAPSLSATALKARIQREERKKAIEKIEASNKKRLAKEQPVYFLVSFFKPHRS